MILFAGAGSENLCLEGLGKVFYAPENMWDMARSHQDERKTYSMPPSNLELTIKTEVIIIINQLLFKGELPSFLAAGIKQMIPLKPKDQYLASVLFDK